MAVAAPTAPALSLRGVAKSFGGRLILDGADLELGPRARVGLIGANGAGKSTLLRMLAGEEQADAGAVTLRRGARVAYLHQTVDTEQVFFRVAFEQRVGEQHPDGLIERQRTLRYGLHVGS